VACAGTQEDVTYQNPSDPSDIDDTAPAPTTYDEALSYVDRRGLTVNNSVQRFRFDVAPFADDTEKANAAKLYPSHAAHLAAHSGAIPSVQTVGTYVKQLDDTIYAGVERAAQDGLAPTLTPKRAILSEALAYLGANRSPAGDGAMTVVAAALRLGGAAASVPPELEAGVAAETKGFLDDPLRSKPFGFYTWSDQLRAIWQQDRLLQGTLDPASACALAGAIGADASRRDRYAKLVELYSRLTNPVSSSLLDLVPIASDASCVAKAGGHAFLSSSKTVEVALFEKLYPAGIPSDANLMQDLIDAIRAGKVDLAPKPDDGWYQYQEYALETLLVTDKSEERAKIAFMAKYKKRLQEAFETMLVEHRETHAKQAGGAETVSAPAPPPIPEFRVEPLATVYVRHARSYVFLEAALDAALGPTALDQASAVGASGAEPETLRARIRRSRDLFYGLYIVAAQDVGLKPKLDATGDPAANDWAALAKGADHWLEALPTDPVAAADVRVMIPIADLDGQRARYWAVIGVRTTLAAYSFINGSDTSMPTGADQIARVSLPTEQFLEVTSSAVPMSRDDFRALCDKAGTAEEIQKALEAR
jgi:hypothetical protein